MKRTLCLAAMSALAVLPASAVVSFVEDFNADAANWRDTTSAFVVNWSDSDPAPGGSAGYATVPFAFNQASGTSLTTMRGHAGFGSSGGAFVGNWVADGVHTFSAMVRHNAPVPLTLFTRFAGPGNFPGAIAVKFAPVFPNTWTLMTFAIDAGSPNFVSFEGTDFESVFANLGNLQIGVDVPSGFESDPTFYNFDLDQVSVTVPEPAVPALALLGAGLLLGRRRRSA